MITLIGHGYIGKAIQKELESTKVEYTWIKHTDDIPHKTTSIINAAGFTGVPNVDQCEISKQETIEGNVVFPLQLELRNKSIPIVHISSGCVYTGYKDGGWTEEDPPNFDFNNGSFYSGSKALGQQLLTPFMTKSYLLRIRMPFGNEKDPKNLLTKLEKYPKLINYKNSLSFVDDIAKIAAYCVKGSKVEPGIYNVCNPGSLDTKQIAEYLGLKKEWFSEHEFKNATVAPRSNCVLNTDKLSKVYPIRDINTVIEECVKIYNEF